MEQFLFTPKVALKTDQTNETAFFFIHLVGLKDPPNHPVSNARAFRLNVNNMAVLVKIESDPFVNKPPVYNTKESFEKESVDSLSLTDKPFY